MFNFDYITKEDIKEHNPTCSKIPDGFYRILIVGGSGSGKTNALLNPINHKSDIQCNKYQHFVYFLSIFSKVESKSSILIMSLKK